jgi:hypothetical protein
LIGEEWDLGLGVQCGAVRGVASGRREAPGASGAAALVCPSISPSVPSAVNERVQ